MRDFRAFPGNICTSVSRPKHDSASLITWLAQRRNNATRCAAATAAWRWDQSHCREDWKWILRWKMIDSFDRIPKRRWYALLPPIPLLLHLGSEAKSIPILSNPSASGISNAGMTMSGGFLSTTKVWNIGWILIQDRAIDQWMHAASDLVAPLVRPQNDERSRNDRKVATQRMDTEFLTFGIEPRAIKIGCILCRFCVCIYWHWWWSDAAMNLVDVMVWWFWKGISEGDRLFFAVSVEVFRLLRWIFLLLSFARTQVTGYSTTFFSHPTSSDWRKRHIPTIFYLW